MLVRYKALGAAKSVTGSRHYFEIGKEKILLDCGLFQGLKELRLRNWDKFPVDPKSINAIALSHAHIDHSGYLPKLVREGFEGPIYCTKGTAALLPIMLTDSAKLQEEEAEWAFRRGYSKHHKPLPLYTEKDVLKVLPYLQAVDLDNFINITPRISLRFSNAGHILGAAITEIFIKGDNQDKTIVYTGDLGRRDDALLHPPDQIKNADILLIESTYGDRSNINMDIDEDIAKIVNNTVNTGCLLIPAFSVGRTQNILYYLRKLMESGKIPFSQVYVDSPMAINVTELYRSFSHLLRLKLESDKSKYPLFDYDQFHYVREQSGSRDLNELKTGAIIISAGGMCTGGRILHHLFHRLRRKNDTLLLVGYQVEGSRGRRIMDGEKEIVVFGEKVPVNCNVELVDGMSAHADKNELLLWMESIADPPKLTFAIHGEESSSQALAGIIRDRFGWNCRVPDYLEAVELFNGI